MDNSYRVLLVEDNEDDYCVTRDFLADVQTPHFELEWVSDYDSALTAMACQSHDVYLLDYHLGAHTGLEILQQALSNGCQAPIIFLTGSAADRQLDLKAMQLGATEFLSKDDISTASLERTLRYAIRQNRLYQQVKQQAQREHARNQIVQSMRHSLDLETIFAVAAKEIAVLLQVPLVKVVQYRPARQCWVTVASYCQTVTLAQAMKPSLSAGAACAAPLEHWEDGCLLDTHYGERQCPSLTQMFPASALLVPLRVSADVWGSLGLVRDAVSSSWQEWEVVLLQTIADQLAIAIQQAELYQQLQTANEALTRLATTDSLTQIANRHHFDASLQSEWQRLTRSQQPLSLILCDIDFFKRYNDTYGHLAGDRCLAQVAQVLQESIRRSTDLAARYGGEEFAILLPNTPQTGAATIAQRLLHQLQQIHLPHEASGVAAHVTLSLGIASLVPNQDTTPQSLIQAADQALYQAKAGGRNTYRIWTETT
ncbi:diguanylate cyclase [Phormidium sp. FACHB-592]|uniref:Diguanylate cyclase n=1 Tax=Stenomitos frigidus AS-A4 TaxID=2933935 RepID=A0ABV0KJS5_9CYAN|nr:diguanylate cyclase [Phormidium sp. FACHB-592]MBD2072720.1 diguanylate cyclase [Phormidium sp. FACHB-592]